MVFQERDTPVIAYINGQRYRGSSTSRIDLIKKLRTGSSINMFTELQIKYRIDVRRCITRIANTTTKSELVYHFRMKGISVPMFA